ncbi:hypothetical protein [Pleomorphovibrio marinus]|uniref:hypothetical protein n=1 Tax=Pleomorphovibrio marinus TaxID=2164132 RepID=UPI000E0B7ADE|nr:hypothetical protein [Pleomorphovibrio marinus]
MARSKPELERDKNFVAEHYLKGYSVRAIALMLSKHVGIEKYVSYRTIHNDLNKLLKEWEKDRIDDINKQKLIELEKINKLERTYWMAWDKSIEDYEKKSKKLMGQVGTDKDGNPIKPTQQEIQTINMVNFGNPAYLSGVEKCIERRCRILGIDAPERIDVTSQGKGFFDFLRETSAEETEDE